ncbi:MAG: TRAP transporter small permease [Lachnospiraceae bacterium]|jgi:TRAP-type C4-dicarboxylate transport system permease small subunit|nr:TRAP transporter small permease [Lachnospiraceae bacterium]MCI8996161.1 TRAP transporter small permease [Lachnospiraceae bacterium]MCI9134611.1 TRAP transporter small permease [Lachnospiraceae bacterium]
MDGLKKVGNFLRNCVELYIPIAAFLIMFSVFVIQIVARYVFNSPVQWAYEVTVMGYLWMVVLGACYAYRDRSHVTFTLVYDNLPVKGKAICGFLGNLLMAIAYIAMFLPSCKMIGQMKIQVTSVFKIGLNIVYLPFIPFMIIILCYILYDMWLEVMVFTGIGGEAAVKKMLDETKNETQEAIEAAVGEEVEK